MNSLLKKSAVIAGLIAVVFFMSASTVNAQEYKYRTSDQKYYIKLVANGDSWTVFTAQSGGNWVGSTMLYSDNNKGYYKAKSHRTGNTFEMWISQANVMTVKTAGTNGTTSNWTYYPY